MRVELTWRLFFWAYMIPMVMIGIAVSLSYIELSEQNQLSINQRDTLCRDAKINASVNKAQNVRLATLLDAATRIGGNQNNASPSGFRLAVSEAKIAMQKENENLQRAINVNCDTQREDSP